MQRKTKATIAAAIGGAMALMSQSTAGAQLLDGWGVHHSAATQTQITSTAAMTPLVGDFNGDERSDVFFYAPGSSADYLWTSKAFDPEAPTGDRFSVKSMSITGTYKPFVGDFDGNGSSDIFWYGPGTTPDSIWYFHGGNLLASVAKTVNGTYTPVAGDFDHVDPDNGNMKDDILWYASGGTSTLWTGLSNRTFGTTTLPVQPPAGAKVLVGNFVFDPDHTGGTYDTDLLFYVPGTGADSLWTGDGNGTFTRTAKTINGTYVPVVGDFDVADEVPMIGTPPEAGLTDVLWYAPGAATDAVWMSTGSGGFSSKTLTISGTSYKPFVIPNLLGGDTIMWNNPSGADVRWQPKGLTGFEYTSKAWPGSEVGSRTPLVGLFDDDDLDRLETGGPIGADVLWVQAGNTTAQTEVLWFGNDSGFWMLQDPELV